MSAHNIGFYRELEKISPELSSSTPPYQVLWPYVATHLLMTGAGDFGISLLTGDLCTFF